MARREPFVFTPALPPLPERVFAGTSGWAYPTWKPGFYPAKLPGRSLLSFYATQLNSVEVNYTFRTLPTSEMLAAWLAAVPATFRFSFKAPQRITHFSRLRDAETHVAEFVAALAPVAEAGKLGVLLFQLPPNFKLDLDRLHLFLAAPALQHLRIAFEFRHESWLCNRVYEVLQNHRAALCIADGDDLATPEIHTATSHACFRLRRDGGYTPEELAAFAANTIVLAKAGREVFTYFRHQEEPTGALNASTFLRLLAQRNLAEAGN